MRHWGNGRIWNVERAIKDAVGVPGRKVYDEWIAEIKSDYEKNTARLRENLRQGRLIEPKGFSNFYPHFSPAGNRIAYVSNKGRDFNALSLYVHDLEGEEVASIELDGFNTSPLRVHTCAFGHKVKSGVGRAYDWHPDGNHIAYVRRRDTPEGYLYADLYLIDIESKKSERLTTRQRATSPTFDVSGERIAFIGQDDGSTNLFTLRVADGEVQQLTQYNNGFQVTDPAWHPSGEWIYFGVQNAARRSIYRVRTTGGTPEAVLDSVFDERSPTFDEAGNYLYFASDRTGIYNIYRKNVEQPDAEVEQITNVLGAAFMPDVKDNRLTYAHYEFDGYKIALLDEIQPVEEQLADLAYTPPAAILKDAVKYGATSKATALNQFDDTDLEAPSIAEIRGEGETEVSKYKNQFTSFSFYPVIRLDQYVSRRQQSLDVRLVERGRLETLARNTKVGVLASSREILEGLNVFGGVMLGLTSRDASSLGDFFSPSRLLKLERDVFFQFDYNKGLGFIPKRWSPQISLEVFNIRRNVDNGLSIEEFPCTACLPDTTLANLSYNLWEASLTARSKVSRNALIEASYRYSPYSVTTERFFSKEFDGFVDDFTSRYYIGNAFQLRGILEWIAPHRHSNVVPNELRIEASYEREIGRLLDRFDLEDGRLEPIYEQHRIHRLSLETRFGMMLPGRLFNAPHGIGIRTRGSTILGKEVDDFFNDFVGGLIGARGYPFYALGGNETFWAQASYIAPIVPRINKQVMFAYFDKLYARVYADVAAAWSGPLSDIGPLRKRRWCRVTAGHGFVLFAANSPVC